jgi:hypothetical protein
MSNVPSNKNLKGYMSETSKTIKAAFFFTEDLE